MQADISRSDWFQQARTLSTPEISDALDFFNLPGSALGIRPVAGPAKLFGLAFTIRFAPIEPEEVAAAAAFLCTPACNSMTGSDLVLDGGWGAR